MKNNKGIKKERGVTIIELAIIAIVVIILVLIVVFVIGRTDKNKEKTDPENTKVQVQIEEKEEDKKEEYVYHMEDGSKLNVSEEMQKEKRVGDLKITNVQLKERKGITTLLADIENIGQSDIEEKILTIEILNKSKEVIVKVKAPIDNIKAGEKVQLNTSVTADVSSAYDFRIK